MTLSAHDKIVVVVGVFVIALLLLLATYQFGGSLPLVPGNQLSARTDSVRLAHHPASATLAPAVCGNDQCEYGELDSCTPCLPGDATCVPTCLPGSCPADCSDILQRTNSEDTVSAAPQPISEPRLSVWQRIFNFFARLF